MSSSSSSIIARAALLILPLAAFGCMPPQQAPPPAAAPTTAATPPRTERHVYRFDFVLTTSDAGGTPTSTSFTLNLQEFDKGEVTMGKNVPLSTASPTSTGTSSGSPRQDVGLKVAAGFKMVGDDALVDVVLEMSNVDPPSGIRKVMAKGSSLAAPGKASLVTTLDDDHKHYQLMVTPTKLR